MSGGEGILNLAKYLYNRPRLIDPTLHNELSIILLPLIRVLTVSL
jgi:hypothetical protein